MRFNYVWWVVLRVVVLFIGAALTFVLLIQNAGAGAVHRNPLERVNRMPSVLPVVDITGCTNVRCLLMRHR